MILIAMREEGEKKEYQEYKAFCGIYELLNQELFKLKAIVDKAAQFTRVIQIIR